jgi:hypothetical protein
MTTIDQSDPRIQQAIAELEALIRADYPEASFQVGVGEDPEGVYLTATVDVADTDAVMDVVIDRLLELQIDEALPIYVIPIEPPARALEAIRRQRAKREPHLGIAQL